MEKKVDGPAGSESEWAAPDEWLLSASSVPGGEIVLSGRGVASGKLVPGTYTLAESEGPDGYTAGRWSCNRGVLAGDELTITAADVDAGVICEITNTYTPPIEVSLEKKVDGPAGSESEWAAPDEWLLTAASVPGGEIVLSGRGVASGELVPGTYTLAESEGPDGYAAGRWSCNRGVLAGDELTITAADARDGVDCSITNTYTPPIEVSLAKKVVGGSAAPGDWLLSASGSGGEISGAGSVSGVLVPGLYTLAESGGPDGYVPEGWVCDGELLPDDQLTITAADADAGVDCSITNTNFEVDPDVVCRDNTRPMISYRVTGLDAGADETVDVSLFDLDNRPVGRFAGRKLNDMVDHPGGAGGASELLRGGGFLVAEVRGARSLPRDLRPGSPHCPNFTAD